MKKDEFTFIKQFYHSHPDHGVEENTFKVDKSRNIVKKKFYDFNCILKKNI